MRAETMERGAAAHSRKPLVVRGSLARTFGGLITFLAISFLFCGLYLLADAFAHPLNAEPASIFAAACAITLAVILFYYLFNPRSWKGPRSSRTRRAG